MQETKGKRVRRQLLNPTTGNITTLLQTRSIAKLDKIIEHKLGGFLWSVYTPTRCLPASTPAAAHFGRVRRPARASLLILMLF